MKKNKRIKKLQAAVGNLMADNLMLELQLSRLKQTPIPKFAPGGKLKATTNIDEVVKTLTNVHFNMLEGANKILRSRINAAEAKNEALTYENKKLVTANKGLTEANNELVKDVQQVKGLYAELCEKYNQLTEANNVLKQH